MIMMERLYKAENEIPGAFILAIKGRVG